MPDPRPTGDRTPAQRQADHASLARLAESLVPALVQKLSSSGLGELEVREGDWRIRLRRSAPASSTAPRRAERPRLGSHVERVGAASPAAAGPRPVAPGGGAAAAGPRRTLVTSPAVGVFRAEKGAGSRVRAGDRIAVVDLLGIAQDVTSPIDGTCRRGLRPGRRGGRVRRGGRRGAGRRDRGDRRAGRRRTRARRGSRQARRAPEPGEADGMVSRVLIANRGEIALRILRACRTIGVEAVVAYSEADRRSLPAMLADEAICIGPADAQALVPLGPGADLGRPRHGLRRGPSGLRLPVRGRRVRRCGPRARPHVHRPARQRPRAVRVQGGDAPAARRAGPAHDPGLGAAGRRGARARGGRADRLPGARQALRRRRRQGHAHGPLAARAGGGPADLPVRGAGGLRRRRAVPRALARGQPPRRGPGRGRPLRPRRPPLGARLLRPAAAPEDPRGVAVAGDDRRPAAASWRSARSVPSSRRATRTWARSSSSSTTTATPTSSRSTAGSRSSTR